MGCINSKCSSVEETAVDCSKATCQEECECSLKSCADPINACLADATCAKGQSCALGCACGDTACSLNCATQAGSPLALPVATCINSKCSSSDDDVNGGTIGLTIKDCGDASTHGKVEGLSPTDLTFGQKTTITATGTVDETVSGGDFTVAVNSHGVKETLTGKVCESKVFDLKVLGKKVGEVDWAGVKCPQAAGPVSLPLTIQLPSLIPASLASGTLAITATG